MKILMENTGLFSAWEGSSKKHVKRILLYGYDDLGRKNFIF